ncbi:MAG: hypothetical protein IPM23_11620 [Candidatus Melainabacteria bacterium]|nr:hypothetical protein [Candidatus Melainabacteria bacterium]
MKAIRTIFLIATLLFTGALLPSAAAASCHHGAPAAMESRSCCACCGSAVAKTSVAATCLCDAPARGDDGIATGRTVSLDLSPWLPASTRAFIISAPAVTGIKSAGEPASPAQPVYILLRRFLS